MRRTLYAVVLSALVAVFAALSSWPVPARAVGGKDQQSLEDRLAHLEKKMAVLEQIALTPVALHQYVRDQAKTLAGNKADGLMAAIGDAE